MDSFCKVVKVTGVCQKGHDYDPNIGKTVIENILRQVRMCHEMPDSMILKSHWPSIY